MSKASILIVEDEAIVAADLAGMLGRLGYGISGTTPRGEEAISLARERLPDLVLMDIRLAGAMDGVEAAGIIHRELGLPVIFLTAHSDHATLERAKLTEPFGYLLKPFEELGLETHIDMALYKHSAERKLRQAHDELELRVEERTRELRVAEQELRESNETLERRVAERTAELQAVNTKLSDSRRAALNMMEDAVAARNQAEEASAELQREVAMRKLAEERLGAHARTLTALNSGNRALLHATDELSLLQAVCRIVVEDCGHAMVWIGFAEEDEEKRVRPVASAGFDEGYLENLEISWGDTERGRGPTGTAIRTGKPCGCDDMLSDPAFEPWRTEAVKRGYSSSLVLPLMGDGKAFGALSIYSPKPHAFADDEAALLMQLADELAYGIRTVRLRIAHDQAYEELRRAKEEWERTFNSVPDLIAIIDDRHRVVRVNKAMADRLAREPEECVGMPCYEAVHGSSLPPDFCPHSRTMGDGGEHNLELSEERLGGDYLVTTTPLLDREGRMTGTVHVARDITERKRAEAALKRAYDEMEKRVEERTAELRDKDQILLLQSRQAAMGEMIGNIAHQWRQPLNTLGLTIQRQLLLYDLGGFTREVLEKDVGSSMEVIKHMSRTIDDFRNYFRPDKEKIEFRVHDAIVNTLSLLEGSLQNPPIGIAIVAKDNPVIYGYQNEFAQALLNILMNARDALLEREIADPGVTITIWSEDGGAVVTVADNAGGIPEEIIDKIFEPYFTTKGPQQGTGVGLFMSKAIIEKNMGGRLTVRNSAGGAEFRIEV